MELPDTQLPTPDTVAADAAEQTNPKDVLAVYDGAMELYRQALSQAADLRARAIGELLAYPGATVSSVAELLGMGRSAVSRAGQRARDLQQDPVAA